MCTASDVSRSSMPLSQAILLVWTLLLLSVAPARVQCQVPYAVQYFMTLSSTPPALPATTTSLLLGDDAPLAFVPLSFTFPSYQPATAVWVDPNGALHLQASTPPCCLYDDDGDPYACDYETPPSLSTLLNRTACTTNTSIGYTAIIAACLMDLDPSSGGRVSFADTGSAFVLRYDAVPWWSYNASFPLRLYSFSMLLGADGSIVIAFDNVSDPSDSAEFVDPVLPLIQRTWLVGLRQLDWLDTNTEYMSDWATSRPGLYPPRGAVQSGAAIVFCPLQTAMCLYPVQGALQSAQNLSLTSSNLACASASNHSYVVQFALLSTGLALNASAWYDAATNALRFTSPVVAAPDTAGVALIDITTDTAVQLASPLLYTFGSPADAWTLPGMCAACAPYNPAVCVADCSGVYQGNATLDACGECSGGSTSVQANANVNCAGTCGGGAFSTTANETVADCLCQQLSYPPIVTGWVPGSNLTGAFIGPIAYYVGLGQFDAATCLVSDTSEEVYHTLDPLTVYTSVILAVSALLLALSSVHVLGSAAHRPLFTDPFHPSLFATPPAAAASAVVVVQEEEEDVDRVEADAEAAQPASEAEPRRDAAAQAARGAGDVEPQRAAVAGEAAAVAPPLPFSPFDARLPPAAAAAAAAAAPLTASPQRRDRLPSHSASAMAEERLLPPRSGSLSEMKDHQGERSGRPSLSPPPLPPPPPPPAVPSSAGVAVPTSQRSSHPSRQTSLVVPPLPPPLPPPVIAAEQSPPSPPPPPPSSPPPPLPPLLGPHSPMRTADAARAAVSAPPAAAPSTFPFRPPVRSPFAAARSAQ